MIFGYAGFPKMVVPPNLPIFFETPIFCEHDSQFGKFIIVYLFSMLRGTN